MSAPIPAGYDLDYVAEIPEGERVLLPATWHRPWWDGLGTPHLWHCTVCWGDGWTTQWPCEPATKGGKALAEALGLGYAW